MTQRVGNPFPFFHDKRGRPLDGGKVYLGEAGQDPQLAPIDAFFDTGLTIAAPQPINVIGGLMSNDGNPAFVFVEEAQYSIRVRDADGAEVFYAASAVVDATAYQPLDADLTAIAALLTTPYGRSLLTAPDAAALRLIAGMVPYLPLAGGAVTGAILRQGAGAHPYMADAAYAAARIFVTANGAPDPTSQNGDIWLELAP